MEKTLKIHPGAAYHLVGIGGIGMSGLAQLLVNLGCVVSGSDRGIGEPENRRIFQALEAQHVRLFPQDGSYIKDSKPDALIYSTAIEDDNPDFTAAPDVARIHRAEALTSALQQLPGGRQLVAVTGSSGKTSVTAWLAETLKLLGKNPAFITGGLANRFASPELAGNFVPGNGDLVIIEADESDKSLLAFNPDYSIILNIGTDHYPKAELASLFRQFLKQTRKGAVIEADALDLIGPDAVSHLQCMIFSGRFDQDASTPESCRRITDYNSGPDGVEAEIDNKWRISLPSPGIHTAANALAILVMLELLGVKPDTAAPLVPEFKGVWRRFDYAGKMASGAKVYDDYAHNVEKICSVVRAAREITPGKVVAVFQPHGYGPFGFMKSELFTAMEKTLRPNDVFALLPVYYAGGTSSFTPKARDVAEEYLTKGKRNYLYFEDREEAEKFLTSTCEKNDTILILGARDNSLSVWARKITC